MFSTDGTLISASTAPHRGGQHSTMGWPDHCAIHQSTQDHRVVRSSCIPPVNTVPHGSQIIVHSTSQHSTTWWSDHHAFHPPTQYHMVVRSSYIPPVNTVPHGGQIIVHSTSQHRTTWWLDRKLARKEARMRAQHGSLYCSLLEQDCDRYSNTDLHSTLPC